MALWKTVRTTRLDCARCHWTTDTISSKDFNRTDRLERQMKVHLEDQHGVQFADADKPLRTV